MAPSKEQQNALSSEANALHSSTDIASGEQFRSSPATKQSSPVGYGAKPLARAVLVCKRCRSKKIKCDQVFPACGSCVKASEPCVGIDSATGREVSRSYIVDLEQQVQELRQQKAELEHRLSNGVAIAGQKRSVDDIKTEDSAYITKPAAQRDGPPRKRSSPLNAERVGPDSLGSGNTDLTSREGRPLLGRLHSRASGLSPARLLCQAIRESAQAGLHVRVPASSKNRPSSSDRGAMEKNDIHTKFLQPDQQQKHGVNRISNDTNTLRPDARVESSSSRSSTPLEGRKNSPYDETDLMQYATTTETGDITVPAPEQLLKPSPLPAPFPPLSTARKLVDAYFERVNPQLPILERSTFMPRFEQACQKALDRAVSKLSGDAKQQALDNKDRVQIEPQSADGHLFHLVFAIAAAMGWTRSKWSAENHHEAAMRFLDPRRHTGAGQDSSVGAIMGRDALEQLQCLLLTALYSIMRPMKPGVWYCLGVALRLTTGLGLYSESPGLLEATDAGASTDSGKSLIEKKRRLFWCSYALDRQVCVHLGRPFGIADADIKVNLPWLDSEVVHGHFQSGNRDDNSSSSIGDQDADSVTEQARREAASTLAGLQSIADTRAGSSSISVARPKDASRWVSLSFFRMRILQSEIQSILHQNAELPRRFQTYEHWKSEVLDRLRTWRRFAPSRKAELEASGCGYNPIFLELNYQQTLLMVHGLSPRFPNASRTDLACVEDCSRSIISMYATLSKEGQMNYTWMTGHNVFLACTSYLYAIWQINATDPASLRSTLTPGFKSKVEEIQHFAAACDKVLASLQWATAEKCRKCLRAMFYATSMVVDKISATRSQIAKPTKARRETNSASAVLTSPSEVSSHRSQVFADPYGTTDFQSNHGTRQKQQVWRENGIELAQTSDVSAQNDRRDWTDQSRQTYRTEPTDPKREQLFNARSDPAGFRPDVQNLIHIAESQNLGITQSGGAASSRGTDHFPAMGELTNVSSGWGVAETNASPRSFLPDSPSNFDISSLMAASAMELDALFREAGLSAGPGGHGSASNSFFRSDEDQGGWFAGPMESSAPLAHYDGMVAHPSNDIHAAPLSYATSADVDAGVTMPNLTRASDNGIDTDWEALGFGYRLGEPASLADPAQTYLPGSGQAPTSANVRLGSGSSTEFDYRFLDSHMGF